MSEVFANVSAVTVFLTIAAVGFLFLLASLIFGDLTDQFGLHDGVGGGHDGGHGFIDSRVIGVFVTSFGGFGAIGVYLGLGVFASSMAGLASAFVLAGVVALFGKFLSSQQASSSVSAAQLVGRTAQVTVTIPAGGLGQVSCRFGEERIERLARSKSSDELKSGVLVRIDEIAADSVIVSLDAHPQSYSPRA